MSLGNHLWSTWRSILSVVLAYGITVALWLYSSGTLQQFVHWSAGVHNWVQDFIGHVSPRGETLFTLFISDATTYITLMILFVRGVVMSLILWVVGALRSGVS